MKHTSYIFSSPHFFNWMLSFSVIKERYPTLSFDCLVSQSRLAFHLNFSELSFYKFQDIVASFCDI